MIFTLKVDICDAILHVNEVEITNVNEFKYLGSILICKLNEKSGLSRIISSLTRMVGMFLRKVVIVELGVKVKLINFLRLPFYGLEPIIQD